MITLHLIVVGSLKEAHWRSAEAEYTKRLQPYAKIITHELKEESFSKKDSPENIKEKEAKKIVVTLEKIGSSFVVALEEKGKQFSSPNFAKELRLWEERHHEIVFVIGGPLGLHSSIQTNTALSLSSFTFTHQMARVILLEQLYRSQQIIHGKPYHY